MCLPFDPPLAPRHGSASRCSSWATNTTYKGLLTWGATHRVKRKGKLVYEATPENVITKDAPQYRLVSDKLWAEANAISDQSAAATWRGADGRLKRRATKSEFLLSPFLACVCGGSMHAKQSGKGDKKRWLYTCTTHHLRGSKACPNGKGIRVEWADAAILKIEQALKEQKARAKDPAPLKAEAEKLRKEMRPGDRCQTEGFTSASCGA